MLLADRLITLHGRVIKYNLTLIEVNALINSKTIDNESKENWKQYKKDLIEYLEIIDKINNI